MQKISQARIEYDVVQKPVYRKIGRKSDSGEVGKNGEHTVKKETQGKHIIKMLILKIFYEYTKKGQTN